MFEEVQKIHRKQEQLPLSTTTEKSAVKTQHFRPQQVQTIRGLGVAPGCPTTTTTTLLLLLLLLLPLLLLLSLPLPLILLLVITTTTTTTMTRLHLHPKTQNPNAVDLSFLAAS